MKHTKDLDRLDSSVFLRPLHSCWSSRSWGERTATQPCLPCRFVHVSHWVSTLLFVLILSWRQKPSACALEPPLSDKESRTYISDNPADAAGSTFSVSRASFIGPQILSSIELATQINVTLCRAETCLAVPLFSIIYHPAFSQHWSTSMDKTARPI